MAFFARSRFMLVSVLVALCAGVGSAGPQGRALTPGVPVEGQLHGGQSDTYTLTLEAGRFLRVTVQQRGLDVTAVLLTPQGEKLIESQYTGGAEGVERLAAVVEQAGDYRLEIRARDGAAPGGYQVVLEEVREAAGEDRSRFQAERLMAEGYALLDRDGAESRLTARQKFEQALALWRGLGDVRGQGEALDNIGWIYRLMGDNPKSIEVYLETLPLRQKAGDQRGEIFSLQGLGGAYNALGEYDRAIETQMRALELSRAIKDVEQEAGALNNLGVIYWTLDEHQKALGFYEEALPLAQKMGNRRSEATLLNNIGSVYRRLGEAQKALDYHQRALDLRRKAGDRRGEGVDLNNIGLVYHRLLGDRRTALDYYQQALRLRRETGDRAGEAYTLNNLGSLYQEAGETRKAIESLEQTLALWQSLASPHGEAETLNGLGEAYYAANEPQTALDFFNRALILSRAIGFGDFEANALYGMARIERDRGDLAAARADIEAALAVFESQRARVENSDLRATYMALARDYYDFYIDLLMRQAARQPGRGYEREALAVSERARARSLLETLSAARAELSRDIGADLLQQRRAAQSQLESKQIARQRLLSGKHTPEQAAQLGEAVAALRKNLQDIEARIRAASPRYAALVSPQPLVPGDVQQLLDGETLLLEYALGERQSYLWAVTRDSIQSYALPPRRRIEEAARRVVHLLTSRNRRAAGERDHQLQARVRRDEADFAAAAEALSRMVLGPVAAQLRHQRLLIVAEGALQLVPFAALPKSENAGCAAQGGGRGTSACPLIVDHEIISLPSASVLGALRREAAERRPVEKGVAVIADPVFGRDDPRLKARPDGNGRPGPRGGRTAELKLSTRKAVLDAGTRDNLDLAELAGGEVEIPRLPFTRREADAILAFSRAGEAFKAVDFQASRATATGEQMGRYAILHFATHALIHSSRPEQTAILLSMVDENGRSQDGFLRLTDIYNLRLNADLVVLSACRTALGREVRGEGLVGLTRGFMYAGATRVAASLWKVDDQATAALMARFYEKMLKEGQRPAAALRAAQMETMRQRRWQSPYFWAAFTMQGDWR